MTVAITSLMTIAITKSITRDYIPDDNDDYKVDYNSDDSGDYKVDYTRLQN